MRLLLVTIFAIAAFSDCEAHRDSIVCYYSSASYYREGVEHFDVSDIDAKYCTHLVYHSADISKDYQLTYGDRYLDPPKPERGQGNLRNFTALRTKYPNRKFLITVGSWSNSRQFSNMAKFSYKREAFIKSAVEFLTRHNLDGLDFDWQYPNQNGGVEQDRENLVQLLMETKAEFEKNGLILILSVGPRESDVDKSYLIPKIHPYVDIINLMTYDFHGPWESKVDFHAPLYNLAGEDHVNHTINIWLNAGVPANKIIFSIPFFGRSYTLHDPNENGIGAMAREPGRAGPILRTNGLLGYNEYCRLNRLQTVNDRSADATYGYQDDQWISMETIESVNMKIDVALSLELEGVSVWYIDYDDWRGVCRQGKNPLMEVIGKKIPLPQFENEEN